LQAASFAFVLCLAKREKTTHSRTKQKSAAISLTDDASWRQRRSGGAIDEAKLSHRPFDSLSRAHSPKIIEETACG
jgi:hypothetical protein